MKAQLQTLQQLRSMQSLREDITPVIGKRRKSNRVTHVDLAYLVLVLAGKPLHAYQLVQQIQYHFGDDLRYKVVSHVLWRSATRTLPFRLLIIAPLRYRRTTKSRLLYRDPADLLTTDLTTPAAHLIQAYFDRWEIEVNHRDEKSFFGVGDAQVRSDKAARRLPQFSSGCLCDVAAGTRSRIWTQANEPLPSLAEVG